jgi:PPM family protein phosphatase
MVEAVESSGELSIEAFGATDIGLKRPCNEDVALVRNDLSLFVICDGAGGHDAGDVAAAAAARAIAKYIHETSALAESAPAIGTYGVASDARRIASALHKANRDVLAVARAAGSKRGMGATAVALLFSPTSSLVHVAHAGDSRCYRWRDGHFEQLTQDHSIINDVIEQRPDLDDGVLARLPKHAVTRALGMEDKLRITVNSHEVVNGDRYLLCTDGLSGPVQAGALAEVLARGEPPAETVAALIDLAKSVGGPDNIAALVVDCVSSHTSELPVIQHGRAILDPVGRSSEPELLLLGIEEVDATSVGDDDELGRVLAQLLNRG